MAASDPLIQASLLGEAVDGADVAVFVADETGRYIAVNRAACELLGYTREELLGLRVTEVADYAESAGEFDEMVREGTRRGTSRLRRKDGASVEFRYRASTTTVAGMTVFVAVGVVD
jgi:PAS domain S-box-containing protein